MTDAVIVALIAMPPPTLLAAVALYKQWAYDKERKDAQHRNEKQATAIQTSVGQVETKVDGRFTELLDLVLKMSKANGFKDGIAAAEKERSPFDSKKE